jgi:hypothetical protein
MGTESVKLTPEEEKLAAAKKRASEKVGFIGHLAIYLLVNALLVVINLVSSKDIVWVIWPILGWGVGLAIHFISAFVLNGFLDRLEQKFIADELKK